MASNPFDQFDAPEDSGATLLNQAVQSYPYLSQSGIVATYSDSGGGKRKLEYWPRGEPGSPQMPRPKNIPLDRPGVEIFDRNVSPKDILADYVSHEGVNSDPELRRMYAEFSASVPDATMRKRYDYHRANLGERRDYETWKERSGMPEYFRGYTFDQWKNTKQFYSPEQIAQLDKIRDYVGVGAQSGANPFDQFDAAPEAQAPPTAPADTRPTGDAVDAVNETAMSLGSSALATPVAGLAGLGTATARGLGMTDAMPGDVVRQVQQALTYEPRTKAGATATAAVSYPFEKLAQGANWAGEKVAEASGSPALGSAVNTGIQFVPALLTRRGGRPVRPATVEPSPVRTQPAQAPTEYVAPDLVLEQTTRPAQASTPSPATPEVRAKEYARSIGVDWTVLPREAQATLTNVAKDARGLEGLDSAAVARQLQLRSLPKPIPATRGQITRDPVQLRNEGNVSATKAGEPIRQVYLDQNQAILDNLDVLKGKVANKSNGAETPEQVGISVQDQALRAKLELKKKEVSAKYKAAEDAGELQGKVSPARLLNTIRDAVDKTQYSWVESWMKANDVVTKTDSGTVTRKLTLKEMEALRQEAVSKAMDGGSDGYHAGKIISAIDQSTEGAGGKLYKEARKARRDQAMEFEETGAIARLVENKSRTDRATAVEDTWRKTVISGSIQDLRNVKRSLLTGGDRATRSAGKRAWRDIKAQTIQHIKDEATKSVAFNERGQPNVTPAAMKRAIDSIGRDKLDEIFGGGTARQIDRLLEATRTVKTVPPAGHAGSSTMSNILSFLERGLGRVPLVGDVATGAVRAGVQLKQMGEAGRIAREAQRSPLQDAEKTAKKRNALADF